MVHILRYTLQDISHHGARIGRDVKVNIKASAGMSLNFKHNVLPDKTTKIEKTLGVIETSENMVSVLLDVTVTEHDLVFNDVGNQNQRITFDIKKDTITTDKVIVVVSERRWFFWKKKAYFTLNIVTKLETEPRASTPTVDNPKWTGNFDDDTDQMILARIIFGEARSELAPDDLRYAVGFVARNRLRSGKRRWSSYQKVITQDLQFSAFNEGEQNRPYVENPLHTGSLPDERAWREAYDIAGKILRDEIADNTKGANHYYGDTIPQPKYYKGSEPLYSVSFINAYGKKITTYFYYLQ